MPNRISIAANLGRVRRVAGMDIKLRGAGGHDFFDHGGIKANTFTCNICPRLPPQVKRFWQHEIHADFSDRTLSEAR